ncbi:hypothetical protein FDP41_013594 [Naegleria fowleri]|uniref:Vitellogenin domain-containing protein n=1 Tax=Naegleria fowleri TaxID=5763 RepID=A0A6A5C3D4_NAEFO|nr:uncharacterized protein FDP41_013594 [Naegleria fowleri]KAF0980380.1 hypothetical protein FDP41_013594 [Naegleria fowleri]
MTLMALALAQALPTSLSYQPGQEFVFNLHGTVDARGFVQTQGQTTNGTTSTLDSTYVHRCDQINNDGSFIFVMNMFNTEVGVGQSVPEALRSKTRLTSSAAGLKRKPKTSLVSLGDAEPLGYDMYFQQLPNGQITNVWYESDDSLYFVNVKLSAITAFQTYVTQSVVNGVLEQDPVGVHTSNYQGVSSNVLTLNKQFSQNNFRSFSDAQVTSNNVQISASSQTVVHASGYIMQTSTSQITNAISMQLGNDALKRSQYYTNSTGFDMNMRSAGSLTIVLANQQKLESFTKISPINNANYTKSTLFEAGKNVIAGLSLQDYKLPTISQDPSVMIQSVLESREPLIKHHKTLKALVKYFSSSAPVVISSLDMVKSVLLKHINLVRQNNDKIMRSKLFYILSGSQHFEEMFVNEFIDYAIAEKQPTLNNELLFHAILALNTGLRQPSNISIRKIHVLFLKYSAQANSMIRDAAILSFGSLVSRDSVSPSVKRDAANTLLEMLDRITASREMRSSDPHLAVSILGAIYNADNIFQPEEIVKRALKLLATEANPSIVSALKMVLSSFAKKHSIPSAKLMLDDSPYPYNRSISKDYNVGGETISIDIHGDLFVGTNFDCNHPQFNYLGKAEAYANVNVLGVKQSSIFDAKAAYGKQGSVAVANEIFLSVFDKVVYQQTLPTQLIDCNLHTYQLYHASPGFSFSYTVWVSIVPITFSAGADLVLNAQWGWQVCDAQLSAMVELIPSADLVVSGKAEIDLLIIRGGVELDASFQAALVPQAYVHGTLCTVGIDVQLQTHPMSADFEAYYMWRDCKYWIFDCHWGQHDTRTLWSWSLPAQQQTLFNKEWKIQV